MYLHLPVDFNFGLDTAKMFPHSKTITFLLAVTTGLRLFSEYFYSVISGFFRKEKKICFLSRYYAAAAVIQFCGFDIKYVLCLKV